MKLVWGQGIIPDILITQYRYYGGRLLFLIVGGILILSRPGFSGVEEEEWWLRVVTG